MSTNQGQVVGLAHIGVFTTNMENSIKFYTDVLGFELDYRTELPNPEGVTQLAFVQAGSCVVELIQPANIEQITNRSHGIADHIALAVQDIEALVARLKEHNVVFESNEVREVPLKQPTKNIFFSGPNGE